MVLNWIIIKKKAWLEIRIHFINFINTLEKTISCMHLTQILCHMINLHQTYWMNKLYNKIGTSGHGKDVVHGINAKI